MSWKEVENAIHFIDAGRLNISLNNANMPTFRLNAKDGEIFESEMFTVNGELQPTNYGHDMQLFSTVKKIMRVSDDFFKVIFVYNSITSVTYLKRVHQKTIAKQIDEICAQIKHFENRTVSNENRIAQLEKLLVNPAIEPELKRD